MLEVTLFFFFQHTVVELFIHKLKEKQQGRINIKREWSYQSKKFQRQVNMMMAHRTTITRLHTASISIHSSRSISVSFCITFSSTHHDDHSPPLHSYTMTFFPQRDFLIILSKLQTIFTNETRNFALWYTE